jgi:hypothetical protein
MLIVLILSTLLFSAFSWLQNCPATRTSNCTGIPTATFDCNQHYEHFFDYNTGMPTATGKPVRCLPTTGAYCARGDPVTDRCNSYCGKIWSYSCGTQNCRKSEAAPLSGSCFYVTSTDATLCKLAWVDSVSSPLDQGHWCGWKTSDFGEGGSYCADADDCWHM